MEPESSYNMSLMKAVDTEFAPPAEDGRNEPDSMALHRDYLLSDARTDLLRHHHGAYKAREAAALNETGTNSAGYLTPRPHLGKANHWAGEAHLIQQRLDRQVELRVHAAFH